MLNRELWNPFFLASSQERRQLLDRRSAEQDRQRQLLTELPADARHQPHGHQGVTSQLEKSVRELSGPNALN